MRSLRKRLLMWAAAGACAGIALGARAAESGIAFPEVRDDRLELQLFAEAPQIVTPTDLAVDKAGRVLVIESHTHMPPEDYGGPDSDRILRLADTSGDGRADEVETFYEGFRWGMGLACAMDGSVYLVTRYRVLRLRDRDGDGKAEVSEEIARLETEAAYPHNGLSGLALDPAGHLYIGLGENRAKPYSLIGSDGAAVSGGHGAGRVFRARLDGSGLEAVATGFWNPFGLCVDPWGRVFATDNDPGDRPPCRLIHVVAGGDYGFERRYRSGQHPFVAWNGELPGTLPMVAGTAEAPGEIIVYESDGLPSGYRGTLLVTSWADGRVERYPLERRGATFSAEREAVLVGGTRFRPVGMDVGPQGRIYISDWADSRYAVHGKGRLWRLQSKDHVAPSRPETPHQGVHAADRKTRHEAIQRLVQTETGRADLREVALAADEARVRGAALRALCAVRGRETSAGISIADLEEIAANDPAVPVRLVAVRALLERGKDSGRFLKGDAPAPIKAVALRAVEDPVQLPGLRESLERQDPFLRSAAIDALSRMPEALLKIDLEAIFSARQRAGILTALKKSRVGKAEEAIPTFLRDPDPIVRLAACKWIADRKLERFRGRLQKTLQSPRLGVRTFKGVLAALAHLDEGEVHFRDPAWEPDSGLLRQTAFDMGAPPAVRRAALRLLPADDPGWTAPRLRSILHETDPEVQLEAIRAVRTHPTGKRDLLAEVAGDADRPVVLRAEAVVGLANAAEEHRALLMGLTTGAPVTLRAEALRGLIGVEVSSSQKSLLENVARRHPSLREAVDRVLGREKATPPEKADLDSWMERLQGRDSGDPSAGRRVFFHPKVANCGRCHQVAGQGRRVGPDLTDIGTAMDRQDLLEAMLQPSKTVAPQYRPWRLETDDGLTRIGLPLRKGSRAEVYRAPHGRQFRVRVARLVAREELTTSLMPAGLVETMTVRELQDLLAFLGAQSVD